MLILAVSTLSACREEMEEPWQGKWDISWTDGTGSLDGVIEFRGERAILKAYGNPESLFLKNYEERAFSWRLDSNVLILTPDTEGLTLQYTLRSQSENQRVFDHLGGITVILQRR